MAGGARLSEDHCERVVNRLDQEIFLIDHEGKILFANNAAEQAVGKVQGGVNFRDLLTSQEEDFGPRMRTVAESNQWLPINAEVARGPMQGALLRIKGRGFRNSDTGEQEILLVADNNRDQGFRQLRDLVKSLNIQLAGKRRANTKLQTSLDAEERLHHELIHRVKNNLSLLSALVGFRRKASEEESVKEALGDLQHRILAISAVHDLLDRAGEIDEVQAGELIRALCEQLKSSVLPEHVEIENELLDVSLSVQDATPLSLLVNELITNAAKHAFSGREQGKVTVSLKKNGVDKLEVNVADNGTGYPERPQRVGSGSRIVKALAGQIGGTLERSASNDGTLWTFIFPHREVKKGSVGLAGDNSAVASQDA